MMDTVNSKNIKWSMPKSRKTHRKYSDFKACIILYIRRRFEYSMRIYEKAEFRIFMLTFKNLRISVALNV